MGGAYNRSAMAKINIRKLQNQRRDLAGKIRGAVGYVRGENVKARRQGWMPPITQMNDALGAATEWGSELRNVESQIRKAGVKIKPLAPRLKKYADRTDRAIDGAFSRAVGIRMKMPREQSMSMSYREGHGVMSSEKLTKNLRQVHSDYYQTGRPHTPMTSAEMDAFHENIRNENFSQLSKHFQILGKTDLME